jgi:hypothetical protein
MKTLSLRRLSSHGTRLLKRALSPEPRNYDDDDSKNLSLFGRLDPSAEVPVEVTSELKVLHDPVLGPAPTVE